MYAILSGGKLLALCEKPRYVRMNEQTGAYVEADSEGATGIAVGGEVYNLPGGTAIQDAPEALVVKRDEAEFIFQTKAHIVKVEETTGTAIVGIEEALCEMDSASEDRVTALEQAMCDMDEIISGGGEQA